MPRSLGKLRFRAPKQLHTPNLSRFGAGQEEALQNRLRMHALDRSKPQTSLSLHYVIDPKWKQQPGKKPHKVAYKPHTVKDLVDPEGTAEHGHIIYVFANVKTGQVIYSLVELLGDHHLEQLPFLGKHSKPQNIRPDEWSPHCVITFPNAEQGLQAFRRLREFRHLHETSWNKTNPEWVRLTPHARMRKIMNQVANTSADLAEVLQGQQRQSKEMQSKIAEQEKVSLRQMKKIWAEAEAIVNDKREANNPKWLKQQVSNLESKLKSKRNRDEADVKRIEHAKESHETRLRRVLRAHKRISQLREVEKRTSFRQSLAEFSAEAATAMALGAEERIKELKESIARERNPRKAVERPEEESSEQTLEEKKAELATLESAMLAKLRFDAKDHPLAREIVLPAGDKKHLPQPFSMNIEIKWTDLRNAEYAADNWPEAVLHDTLDLRSSRRGVNFLTAEQYHISVEDEVQGMVRDLERQALEAQGLQEEEPEPEPEKTGVSKYLPELRNPFRRAEA